ncbi:hypothetical protein V7024_22740 [Bacillus sp. JJ864]|uniref:hypothetical protein n=1 Tax=Bacillus sp. JJ864 TaxID=3122975 RepID=UPI002FFF34E4
MICYTEPATFVPMMIPKAAYPSIRYRTVYTQPLLNGTNTHIQKLYFHTFPPVYGTKYYVTYSYSHLAQAVVVPQPVFYAPKMKSYINHMQPYVKAQVWEG